ncbi:MAG: helix-turn-helix transcriptional regulator [Clostridia bacterium]|nr:helix-turn-helix transcriptional regulator [Clostridia bacterium]
MNTTAIAFPERLRQLRTAKDLTQSELADELNVSRNSIFFYEAGKRNPDIVVLKKIADYFGVTCDYMIGASINKTDETRDIGDELGLSDEAIATLKDVMRKADNDFNALLYAQNINKIICNEKLIFEIATFISPNYKTIFADFIVKDIPDHSTENSKKQTFEDVGIPYTPETRKQISELLRDSMDCRIMRHIQDELELMRGEEKNNADKKD